MNINFKQQSGFTLAELLIALAILGIIATFTIPKVLQNQQDTQWEAGGKEFASMLSGAFQAYKSENTLTSTTTVGDLTPYMNYVRIDTVSVIDQPYGTAGTAVCGSGSSTCLALHSGAITRITFGRCFFGNTNNHAISFSYDPDGQVTDAGGPATGRGKLLGFVLYYNGRITSKDSVLPNTIIGLPNCAGTTLTNPNPAEKPEWFDW